MTLRGWHERLISVYQVKSVNVKGDLLETMEVENVVNEQSYTVRAALAFNAFTEGELVFSALLPWRGQWYWSGEQRVYKNKSHLRAEIKTSTLEKSPQLAYRYCPDLAQKALEVVGEHGEHFRQFFGSDMVAFSNGAALKEAKIKQIRDMWRAAGKAGGDPEFRLEARLSDTNNGVALFYNPEDGEEIAFNFNLLRAAMQKGSAPLSADEVRCVADFLRGESASPAFVRRLVKDYGSQSIAHAFLIKDFQETPDLDYLLHKFKGYHFRKHYPSLSFRQDTDNSQTDRLESGVNESGSDCGKS